MLFNLLIYFYTVLTDDYRILYLTFSYHWQIGTTKSDILKLFDSIEKYGMWSFCLLVLDYTFLVLIAPKGFLSILMGIVCFYILSFCSLLIFIDHARLRIFNSIGFKLSKHSLISSYVLELAWQNQTILIFVSLVHYGASFLLITLAVAHIMFMDMLI